VAEPTGRDRPDEEPSERARAFHHTRWQSFVRGLFKVFGPAQTGLPIYPTPEEREAWRLGNQPEAPVSEHTNTAPPGYRIVEYRDAQGLRHRSLIPIASPPGVGRPPEPPTD
jgi:hypothetical protein